MLHICRLWHKAKDEKSLDETNACEAPESPQGLDGVTGLEVEIEELMEPPYDAPSEDDCAQEAALVVPGADADIHQVSGTVEFDENAPEPILCGVQIKMPPAAMNGEPVVRFMSGTGEENINAERPVFNILTSRPDRDDRLTMRPGFKDVRMALARWQNAVHYFESVTNPELIDFAVYELEAAKRQYVFLLKLAKDDLRREGILVSGGA